MQRRQWLLGCAALIAAAEAQAEDAARPAALAFPADLGAHPAFGIEWWYITGQLDAADGGAAATWGFQVTFFRSRSRVPADATSRFAATQLLSAHAAVTDLAAGRLRHDQRAARAGFGIAEAAPGDTAVHIRDWSLTRREGRYDASLKSDAAGFELMLGIAPTQPLLLQGDAGYSRKGPDPGQASRYYSEPQLQVTGTLALDGRSRRVAGRAWLDHEWSDTLLHPDTVGWDWIGMNLADGSALMAFRIRRREGAAGDATLWAGGSFRRAGGTTQVFGPQEVRFTPDRWWTSPATQARYPVRWRVETPAGRFTVTARLDAQELDSRASTGTVYWEGLSMLQDAAGREVGSGYLEMTGYAGRLRL